MLSQRVDSLYCAQTFWVFCLHTIMFFGRVWDHPRKAYFDFRIIIFDEKRQAGPMLNATCTVLCWAALVFLMIEKSGGIASKRCYPVLINAQNTHTLIIITIWAWLLLGTLCSLCKQEFSQVISPETPYQCTKSWARYKLLTILFHQWIQAILLLATLVLFILTRIT